MNTKESQPGDLAPQHVVGGGASEAVQLHSPYQPTHAVKPGRLARKSAL